MKSYASFMDAMGWPVLHPILIGLYPAVAILARNIQEIEISQAYRSVVWIIAAAGVLSLILRGVFGDWDRAAVMTTIVLLMFFSYGHVYTVLKTVSVGGFVIGRHRILIPVWGGLAVVGIGVLLKMNRDLSSVHRYLNVTAIVALIFPLVAISVAEISSVQEGKTGQAERSATILRPEKIQGDLPDIYYIVLDAYAREDILMERYEYDNSSFLERLESKGFYVASKSNTNYSSTALSLSSSLNMDYFPALNVDLSDGHYPGNMEKWIQESRVRQELEQLGYSTIALATGYKPTEITDADYFLIPEMAAMDNLTQRGTINPFEGILLHGSAIKIIIDFDVLRNTSIGEFVAERMKDPENLQKEIVLSAFEWLEEIPDLPGPKFVFAHIVSPHRPYFFGSYNRSSSDEPALFTFADTNTNSAWRKDVPRYSSQVAYVNSRIEAIIENIISAADTPPIIIIQGDHGPELGLDWNDPDDEAIRSRVSILNAYYLPEDCVEDLYENISPVNSFRVIFNCRYSSELDYLDDVTYFSPNVRQRPWELIQVDPN